MTALYVYALVPAGLDADLGTGLLDEPLQIIRVGPMAAVVGEVSDTPSIAPASLRRHDEVVRAIARASDAILPFRFGAVVVTARELADGLAPRFEPLSTALKRTRGCDQMTLRLYANASSPAGPGPAPAGPGTAWLRARSSRHATTVPELAPVRAALAAFVRAENLEVHDEALLRASIFHLVARAQVAPYRAALESLAPSLAPARVVATGPWPPYAFTEIE